MRVWRLHCARKSFDCVRDQSFLNQTEVLLVFGFSCIRYTKLHIFSVAKYIHPTSAHVISAWRYFSVFFLDVKVNQISICFWCCKDDQKVIILIFFCDVNYKIHSVVTIQRPQCKLKKQTLDSPFLSHSSPFRIEFHWWNFRRREFH